MWVRAKGCWSIVLLLTVLPAWAQTIDLGTGESRVVDIELAKGQFVAAEISTADNAVQAVLNDSNGRALYSRNATVQKSARLAAIAEESGIFHLVLTARKVARMTL